jgi:hypothetical protein
LSNFKVSALEYETAIPCRNVRNDYAMRRLHFLEEAICHTGKPTMCHINDNK